MTPTPVTDSGYRAHRDCTQGDYVIATDTDGTEYRGTVYETVGATVYVHADETGQMLEFRRTTGTVDGTDERMHAILLGIDGKSDVEEHDPVTGPNKDGLDVTRERTTISFDHYIVDFDAEHQQLVLGDE
jgi:hypothetical protein